jgi:hypothetical protein
MAWHWRFERADGSAVSVDEPPEQTFTNQADAETWLGENWRALREAGVDQVALLDDGSVEYEMSLHPDEGGQA